LVGVITARSLRLPALVLAGLALAAGAVAARGSSSSSLTPPATLGTTLMRLRDVPIEKQKGQKDLARRAAWNGKTSAAVSAAYGGPQAVAETYSTKELEVFALLVAVRAPSPKLYAPYVDAKYLDLARPEQEARVYGDVQCLVQNLPTLRPAKPTPDKVFTILCQRSGPHLTVQLRDISGPALQHHPEIAAQMVDQAYAAMS
jgi:hypothetical protein